MKSTLVILTVVAVSRFASAMQMPTIKLYEFHNGNLAVLDAPPNTDVVLTESDNSTERYVLLQCRAPYPIQWIYSGDGIPEFVTNTSVQWDQDPTEFTASAGLFRLAEHHTGTYTCRSIQSTKIATFYYLFITGDSLLTAAGGDTIMFKPSDPSVRLPCSVSHPKVRVTLQKLVDGYTNCPVNDSITFNLKTGFTLAVSDAYQPEGDYICIGHYKGRYTVTEYRVQNIANLKVPEPEDYPQEPAFKPEGGFGSPGGGGVSNDYNGGTGSGSYQPGSAFPSTQSKLKCSSFPCGRNSVCRLNSEGEPVCKCQRHFHGDPYVKCFPECSQDADCPMNRICSENACYDPCPTVCGVSLQMLQSCKVENHTAICDYNHCNPSPCGPYSKCEDLKTKAVCSCLPGYFGMPPRCSETPITKAPSDTMEDHGFGLLMPSPSRQPSGPRNPSAPLQPSNDEFPQQIDFTDVCASNRECPPTLQCVNRRCTDPCSPNPCGRSTLCHVEKHEPVCTCAPGFIKVNQYCLPTNCRSQRDCPDNKACVRNKCINPCAGYCGKNTECRVQLHLPRCLCSPGFSGNPFKAQGCTRITVLTGASAGSVQPPLPASIGLPGPGAVLGTQALTDLACGPTRAKCGKNAMCKNNSTCECEDGYSGDPNRFCYLIISIPDAALTDTESEAGFDPEIALGKPVASGPNPSNRYPSSSDSNSISGSIPSNFNKEVKPPQMIITRDSCTRNEHCPSDKVCHSGTCMNPCVFFSVCGENQECLTINHKATCQCKIGYPIKIYNNCYARENFTALSKCEPTPCGPNSECSVSEHGVQCKCKPNSVGSPPECKTKCTENFECPELLACSQGVCQDPCENACGKLARCRVYHQTAKCFCPRGFQGNPRVVCIPPKFNSRLAGENQGSLIEIFDKSDPGSSYPLTYSYTDDESNDDSSMASGTESLAGFDDEFTSISVESIMQNLNVSDQSQDELGSGGEYVLKVSDSKVVLETNKKFEQPKDEKDRILCNGDNCSNDEIEDDEATTPADEALPSTAARLVTKAVTSSATFKPPKLADLPKLDTPHYDDYADDSKEFAGWKN